MDSFTLFLETYGPLFKDNTKLSKIPIQETAEEYFVKCTENVFIERIQGIETFKQYREHNYQGNCYYYSFYALMGMKPSDYLLRGSINMPGHIYYRHGWVEFEFENKHYIYDCLLKGIVLKEDWYEQYEPQIEYKKTQQEILEEFLNERCAFKVNNSIWQFKNHASNLNTPVQEISFDEMSRYSQKHEHIPELLSLARIELNRYSNTIKRFIAYHET